MNYLPLILCLLLAGCTGHHPVAGPIPEGVTKIDLETGFRTPPDEVKPRVFWWWLQGNISREGILSDLTEMKKAGIKGAIVFDAGSSSFYTGGKVTYSKAVLLNPPGPGFMSDEWRKLFAYACQIADSLDLELSMNITSGWNDGGPWVTPEYTSKKLVWSELRVKGPAHLSEKLSLPQGLLKTGDYQEPFYRNVATLAVKQTPNSEMVSPLENIHIKAVHSIGIPMITNGLGYDWGIFMKEEPLVEGDYNTRLSDVIDISDHVDAGGNIIWDIPEGDYLILRFGYTGTGIRVSTHSPGGGGLAIDYMSLAATKLQYEHTAAIIFKDLSEMGVHSLKYLHDDSWELGAANWTEGMEEEFNEANGYDIRRYLPVIAGQII
ncbi:hypothetical protein EZS27_012417 [termite gut metagenome]|uniref:Uncharacterized protein n=1 Tax=termite gut metagenome TaxID=433724 RepID=A0A5J4S360_9ZZZZ